MTLETCDPKVPLMLSNGQEREKDARTGEERGRALSSLRGQGEISAMFFWSYIYHPIYIFLFCILGTN